MGYKRANWHSGLTYLQTCEACGQVVEYTDEKLGFRPWYPDGFVYCTRCQTPLRHNEAYAINKDALASEAAPAATTPADNGETVAEVTAEPIEATPAQESTENTRPLFCTKCGKKFGDDDNFCAGCGAKRA